jgi:ribonuclease G
MTKEIIVNAGEMESRVAILENGRLMELHVEREPKIVGNIYKGRVTKVLKGMDAAFVDIGIERNAFLSVSDVVPQDDDADEGGNGRINRRNLPPITQLLRGNQEIMVQVVRAPMGTKGARITTRLSLPGRYMVLMLNSGSYVGVSRKIEDPKERARLRTIANNIRPEGYSLIVRTEAEGKSEEELHGDLTFLLDLATRTEKKAASSGTPSLVHGDLTLIFRLIRDAFTRDVNRVVVDSPSAYEGIVELVEMLSPGLKNRIFLYEEEMPIFHAYNVEPEIERTLRRRVWLPSGGSLIIDQAEALTAIDVNTGRFVGSVELAETVLTTNLQAAEEVARQLRLRDLGGIIVVDFIDMDNPRHRQQVTRAFEEALRRDRAKLKVHSISPLGLVEMTRKRTGESLTTLLTEPCPYCSGIGRVQNALTMAMRIQRDLAATVVEHPTAEAILVVAHPRVVANVLGFEGEVHYDLEEYLGRPVYLRADEQYHPNTYRIEQLTLEQALAVVPHLEEGEVIEAQVVNPDPELALTPLVTARGIFLIATELDAPVGARVKVRVARTGTSLAFAEPLAEELRGIRAEKSAQPLTRPPLVPESILPTYLREELANQPPPGLRLLSPTAEALEELAEGEEAAPRERVERGRTHRERGRRKRVETVSELTIEPLEMEPAIAPPPEDEAETPDTEHLQPASETAGTLRRRRRRRRSYKQDGEAVASDDVLNVVPAEETPEVAEGEDAETEEAADAGDEGTGETPATRRRRRRGGVRHRRRRTADETAEPAPLPEIAPLEPVMETISAAEASEALENLLAAIPGEEDVPVEEAAVEEETPVAEEAPVAEMTLVPVEEALPAPEKPARRRRTRETRAKQAEPEQAALIPVEEALPAPEKPVRRRAPRKRKTEETPAADVPTTEAPAE